MPGIHGLPSERRHWRLQEARRNASEAAAGRRHAEQRKSGAVIEDNKNLTADDFDWLRKLKAATDLKRDPPPIPMNIAAKLATFGLAKPNRSGAFTITSKGRDELLDQDMRDAEDR